MQLSWQHFAGGIGLVFAAMIAWFGALWLNLQGANLWVFRLCIFLVLALAVGAIVWWLRNRQKTKPAGETSSGTDGAAGAGVAEDILLILREAEARVASSTQLPRGTRLSSLPVIFLVGDSAAGKTCVATQSGLEPELLSGQVYQEGNIAPTRLANLWFARKAVFVEMGGKTLGDANLWTRLLHRLAPGKFWSIFSGKPAAPRAAVVCYDSEKLAKAAGPEEITTQSRAIRARLEQISQTLGINFPVYVLFTRADRLPFFDDFFRNLSDSEVTQVLGVTLPPLPASATGVYAEQETKRLTAAFNSMFYSLAECRPGLLYRERNSEKLPGIYEFPRELQKRIAIATQFLVDLCRPSHLRTSPFLRGFYFTGIRQVEAANPLGGTVMASKTSIMPARPFSANATSIMRADDFTKTQSQGWQTSTMGGSAGEAKKTAQWLFLSHIFSHVILQDRAALGASGTSSRANVWKRVLLAIIGGLAAIWFIGMVISYFGNRALEQDVRGAADAIVPIKAQAPSMASLEDLQRLDAARVQLQKLTEYHPPHSAPLHLRWGLYGGNDIYDDYRNLYFARFRQLLLDGVEVRVSEYLRSLPPAASPTDEWKKPYDSLRAYLITTSHPDKSTREFLSPVLMDRWMGNSTVDEQRQQIARAQFDFYADELRVENPFSIPEDSFVVQPARKFLNSFATGAQLVYQKLLVKAIQAVPGFNFLKEYPDAKDIVSETKIVDGAYTGAGWKVMIQAISQRENYAGGDDWVLGPAAGSHSVQNVSPQDVRALYEADYKKQWRDFLNAAAVRHFAGPQDESRQLEKLSGNRSPLLALFCAVSQNTSEASPEIAGAFQPVLEVVAARPAPQSCREQLKQPSNDAYTNSLLAVKLCLDSYLMMPPQPGVTPDPRQTKLSECNGFALQAANAARQIVKTNDATWKVDTTVMSLLLSPTAPPRREETPGGPTGVPPFCSALRSLEGKFPFDPNSHQVATLAELSGVFQPGTGAVSKFLDANKAVFELQGSQYVQKSGKTSFAYLINQATSVQRALFAGNSTQPQFQFNLRAHVPDGKTSETVTIDGQELKLTGTAPSTKTFTWTGTPAGATLTLSGETYGQYPGPWGVFRLFNEYTWTPTSVGFHLEWPIRGQSGQIVQYNGKDEVAEFELESVSVPLFKRGYIEGMKCPAGAK
jgi:type VI secretion system protein ImpL